ncbi:PQQ-dependent sugar dehydrogenase [Sporosarcina highlanderae]|uniref:PQQ-dependent sugar dehydrogenase n=1 Tax=Sporosarcina highlanderae TaxID=3035916 RepID=A0ABT8JT08_9BACL|nr:PQQ-dependent sugar dehydrogenase [Sporosarcina highlanderae]MDN4608032.1 PQQ-dependent sugar dehydrogenase [Sporosarcina highlanderae]
MINQELITNLSSRKLNPDDILVPEGFEIDVFATGLTTPINITFTENGEMLVADSGIADGNGKVLKQTENGFSVIADGFNPPLTGITVYQGNIYVAHRRFVTMILPDGTKKDIISGLPSNGDHHNNRVVFGRDGKMYFGQGTATNSGVVGLDNDWVKDHPFFHDYPGSDVTLNGENFTTTTFVGNHEATTGAYSPFGIPSYPGEKVNGIVQASGSILRANPDGSDLELVAWGLRNPFRIHFDSFDRLFSTNHGMDVRGSRPVANSPDEFQWIRPGMWYGFPDFTGGLPLTMPQFKPENGPQPEFLLAKHPMQPPMPVTVFAPHSATMGFSFNEKPAFGPIGDVYIAEFGADEPVTTGGEPLPIVGHRISRIDMRTGEIFPFAINRTGLPASLSDSGGFERPIDAVFGTGDVLYVADFGVFSEVSVLPRSGVIWRIRKTI